jgi:hypothetical protein
MSTGLSADTLRVSTGSNTLSGLTTVPALSSTSLGSFKIGDNVTAAYLANTTNVVCTFTTPDITGATTLKAFFTISYSCMSSTTSIKTVTHTVRRASDSTVYATDTQPFFWQWTAVPMQHTHHLVSTTLPTNTSCQYVITYPLALYGNTNSRINVHVTYLGISA